MRVKTGFVQPRADRIRHGAAERLPQKEFPGEKLGAEWWQPKNILN